MPLTRRYWDLRTDIVGPKFTKVWDTPDNGYAEKYKHTIEPMFTIQRLTSFDDYDRIPKLEGYDFTYGGTTRIAYGIVNRFTAKRRAGESAARTRDFLSLGVTQSYYSDPNASLYDFSSYPLNYFGREPSNFSPINFSANFSPNTRTNITTRLDWDDRAGEFQSIRLNGSYGLREWLDVAAAGASASSRSTRLDPTSSSTRHDRARRKGNRIGGTYAFYYDIGRSTMLDQRIIGYYNAQCCGIVIEYQEMNFPQYSAYAVPQDRRFNIGFTLAGLGTFSNFLGAFGGNTGTTGSFGDPPLLARWLDRSSSLARQGLPVVTSCRCCGTTGPVEGWYRPGVPPPATRAGARRWRVAGVPSTCETRRPSMPRSPTCSQRRSTTWPVPPTRARPGRNTDITLELNARVTHVLLRAMARHAPDARVLVTTSAAVYAPSDAPQTEDAPIGAGHAVRRQQAGAGDGGARRPRATSISTSSSCGRSTTSGPGQDPGFFAPAFARQLARIEAGLEPGRCASATCRRGATCLTCATRCARIAC